MAGKTQFQIIEENGIKIFIFSWNTESTRLCETIDPEIKEYNRSAGLLGIKNLEQWYDADIADFFTSFLSEIKKAEFPEIIVIGFQEDAFPGSYFHSHMLKTEMPKNGYSLVKRTNLKGMGVTSVKAIKNWDIMARGLRLSVYAEKELAKLIEFGEIDLRSSMDYDGQAHHVFGSGFNKVTRGKGSVVSYVICPTIGTLAFICTHFPFDSDSLIEANARKDLMIRQDALSISNLCFNETIRAFVLSPQFPVKPDYVFFFGDFNYRVQHPIGADQFAIDIEKNYNNKDFYVNIVEQCDELTHQIKIGTIYNMQEGVNNMGPLFAPTCKLVKPRGLNGKIYKTGKHNQRVPSWCDRILYMNYTKSKPFELSCMLYDRFDAGAVMEKSDHAAVIGLFDINPIEHKK